MVSFSYFKHSDVRQRSSTIPYLDLICLTTFLYLNEVDLPSFSILQMKLSYSFMVMLRLTRGPQQTMLYLSFLLKNIFYISIEQLTVSDFWAFFKALWQTIPSSSISIFPGRTTMTLLLIENDLVSSSYKEGEKQVMGSRKGSSSSCAFLMGGWRKTISGLIYFSSVNSLLYLMMLSALYIAVLLSRQNNLSQLGSLAITVWQVLANLIAVDPTPQSPSSMVVHLALVDIYSAIISGIVLYQDSLSILIPLSNFSKNKYLLLENSSYSGLENKEIYFLFAINLVLLMDYFEGTNRLDVIFVSILILESPMVMISISLNFITGWLEDLISDELLCGMRSWVFLGELPFQNVDLNLRLGLMSMIFYQTMGQSLWGVRNTTEFISFSQVLSSFSSLRKEALAVRTDYGDNDTQGQIPRQSLLNMEALTSFWITILLVLDLCWERSIIIIELYGSGWLWVNQRYMRII